MFNLTKLSPFLPILGSFFVLSYTNYAIADVSTPLHCLLLFSIIYTVRNCSIEKEAFSILISPFEEIEIESKIMNGDFNGNKYYIMSYISDDSNTEKKKIFYKHNDKFVMYSQNDSDDLTITLRNDKIFLINNKNLDDIVSINIDVLTSSN